MDKNEILAKSRTEKNKEYENKVLTRGQVYGFFTVITVCLLLTAIDLIFLGITNTFNYAAILFAFATSIFVYSFVKTKKKKYLIGSIVCALLFAFALTSYIIMALK